MKIFPLIHHSLSSFLLYFFRSPWIFDEIFPHPNFLMLFFDLWIWRDVLVEMQRKEKKFFNIKIRLTSSFREINFLIIMPKKRILLKNFFFVLKHLLRFDMISFNAEEFFVHVKIFKNVVTFYMQWKNLFLAFFLWKFLLNFSTGSLTSLTLGYGKFWKKKSFFGYA